jgi:hypothetical protein
MRQVHVIGLTCGTAFLFVCLTMCIVGAIIFSNLDCDKKSPEMFRPKTGAMGEIENQINELKYGPVNLDAAKEVKNGLFGRIRANRQARVCQPATSQACSQQSFPVTQSCYVPAPPSPLQVSQVVVQPTYQPTYRILDPSDCNYSYAVANPVLGQTIVAQSTGFEMPIASPINPIEPDTSPTAKDCVACKSPRNAVKTGSFICSNCRRSQVGEWHTDWNDDGTPVTFLCEKCHSLMTPDQREKAFTAYQARQLGKAGITGLLHQEIGQ